MSAVTSGSPDVGRTWTRTHLDTDGPSTDGGGHLARSEARGAADLAGHRCRNHLVVHHHGSALATQGPALPAAPPKGQSEQHQRQDSQPAPDATRAAGVVLAGSSITQRNIYAGLASRGWSLSSHSTDSKANHSETTISREATTMDGTALEE
ncbi:hypothetical protein [Paenarthrobacter ureafaciens]|uniref:hypothetical protein n=1 Tax=Paenarthrobacter ureafaciens TaxID=37931 RepID=UPI001FB21691|nr:hypothetical protein [Paenarthrobacter ureafaciens]UOD82891.1 hypothetical protein MQZ73_08650 [Paenarthrobacter ureafaciens]WNZ02598.1 hypothetical protein PVT25_13210 [Paenarthrobacter ureafaciens]